MLDLRGQPVGSAEQEDRLANIGQVEHSHQQTRQTHTKATVRRAAVAEEVQVELNGFQAETFFNGLFGQHIVAVFALRAGDNFRAVGDQVEALGQLGVIGVAHVVERAHG